MKDMLMLIYEDDYLMPDWENEIVNFPDTHPMSHTLRSLMKNGGRVSVCDYIKTNHADWIWTYCEECNENSPIWEADSYFLCAVCWAEIDVERDN